MAYRKEVDWDYIQEVIDEEVTNYSPVIDSKSMSYIYDFQKVNFEGKDIAPEKVVELYLESEKTKLNINFGGLYEGVGLYFFSEKGISDIVGFSKDTFLDLTFNYNLKENRINSVGANSFFPYTKINSYQAEYLYKLDGVDMKAIEMYFMFNKQMKLFDDHFDLCGKITSWALKNMQLDADRLRVEYDGAKKAVIERIIKEEKGIYFDLEIVD